MQTGTTITPGGYRDPSHVSLIEPGQTVNVGGERSHLIRLATKTERETPDFGIRPKRPNAANWICAAWWQNKLTTPVLSFKSTWIVPPAPRTHAAQLIYLFNGMQPAFSSPLRTILQPVLQWGQTGADPDGVNRTGPFWTVASWVVPDATGTSHHTPHVRVSPGDVLIGVVSLSSQADGLSTYSCEFQGLGGTKFAPTNMPELFWCVHALEAYELGTSATPPYDLDAATEYPDTDRTAFHGINVHAASAIPSLEWSASNYVTKFGEHTQIVSGSSTDGGLDLCYRKRLAST